MLARGAVISVEVCCKRSDTMSDVYVDIKEINLLTEISRCL